MMNNRRRIPVRNRKMNPRSLSGILLAQALCITSLPAFASPLPVCAQSESQLQETVLQTPEPADSEDSLPADQNPDSQPADETEKQPEIPSDPENSEAADQPAMQKENLLPSEISEEKKEAMDLNGLKTDSRDPGADTPQDGDEQAGDEKAQEKLQPLKETEKPAGSDGSDSLPAGADVTEAASNPAATDDDEALEAWQKSHAVYEEEYRQLQENLKDAQKKIEEIRLAQKEKQICPLSTYIPKTQEEYEQLLSQWKEAVQVYESELDSLNALYEQHIQTMQTIEKEHETYLQEVEVWKQERESQSDSRKASLEEWKTLKEDYDQKLAVWEAEKEDFRIVFETDYRDDMGTWDQIYSTYLEKFEKAEDLEALEAFNQYYKDYALWKQNAAQALQPDLRIATARGTEENKETSIFAADSASALSDTMLELLNALSITENFVLYCKTYNPNGMHIDGNIAVQSVSGLPLEIVNISRRPEGEDEYSYIEQLNENCERILINDGNLILGSAFKDQNLPAIQNGNHTVYLRCDENGNPVFWNGREEVGNTYRAEDVIKSSVNGGKYVNRDRFQYEIQIEQNLQSISDLGHALIQEMKNALRQDDESIAYSRLEDMAAIAGELADSADTHENTYLLLITPEQLKTGEGAAAIESLLDTLKTRNLQNTCIFVNVDTEEYKGDIDFNTIINNGTGAGRETYEAIHGNIFWNFGRFNGTVNSHGYKAGNMILANGSFFSTESMDGRVIASSVQQSSGEIHQPMQRAGLFHDIKPEKPVYSFMKEKPAEFSLPKPGVLPVPDIPFFSFGMELPEMPARPVKPDTPSHDSQPQPTPESKSASDPEPVPEPDSTLEPKPASDPEPVPEPQPTPEAKKSEPVKNHTPAERSEIYTASETVQTAVNEKTEPEIPVFHPVSVSSKQTASRTRRKILRPATKASGASTAARTPHTAFQYSVLAGISAMLLSVLLFRRKNVR